MRSERKGRKKGSGMGDIVDEGGVSCFSQAQQLSLLSPEPTHSLPPYWGSPSYGAQLDSTSPLGDWVFLEDRARRQVLEPPASKDSAERSCPIFYLGEQWKHESNKNIYHAVEALRGSCWEQDKGSNGQFLRWGGSSAIVSCSGIWSQRQGSWQDDFSTFLPAWHGHDLHIATPAKLPQASYSETFSLEIL